VEQVVTQRHLEKKPLVTPFQYLPTDDCEHNFLDFEERCIASLALKKLADKRDFTLMSLFQVRRRDIESVSHLGRGRSTSNKERDKLRNKEHKKLYSSRNIRG
jgi:hypothetical protein